MRVMFCVIMGVSIAFLVSTAQGETGNGAPKGPHYNLNIIGVPKNKTADMTGNNGHRIFVKLEGKTKILLCEGDFAVLDANGTDGSAKFQLPNPDPDGDGTTVYSVYARALGKPNGIAVVTTKATGPGPDGIFETEDDEEIESLVKLEVERKKGRSRFTNVSKELLYIYAIIDTDGDGDLSDETVQRIPLFDDRLEDYFWEYENGFLKLLQLRFYPVETTVPDADEI